MQIALPWATGSGLFNVLIELEDGDVDLLDVAKLHGRIKTPGNVTAVGIEHEEPDFAIETEGNVIAEHFGQLTIKGNVANVHAKNGKFLYANTIEGNLNADNIGTVLNEGNEGSKSAHGIHVRRIQGHVVASFCHLAIKEVDQFVSATNCSGEIEKINPTLSNKFEGSQRLKIGGG